MHVSNACTHTPDFFQILFNIFVNVMEEMIQIILIKFSDDIKLGGSN